MADLQCQQVVGVLDAEVFQAAPGQPPVAVHPLRHGLQVARLAVVVRQGAGALQGGAGLGHGAAFAAHEVQPGAQHVAHDQFGGGR
ncbi:hypothetical protein D3C84_993440 [compost metagenome]